MRLSEIQLLSDDLAETERYYNGILGLKKIITLKELSLTFLKIKTKLYKTCYLFYYSLYHIFL